MKQDRLPTLKRGAEVLALAAVLLRIQCVDCPEINDLLDDLARATATYRPLAARLTATGYSPCVTMTRSPSVGVSTPFQVHDPLGREEFSSPVCSLSAEPDLAILEAVLPIDRQLRRFLSLVGKTPQALHLQALLRLVLNRDRPSVERAIDLLSEARLGRPTDPAILSDLSATYFTLAQLTDRPDLLFESYTATVAALANDPSHEEALFNQALVLSRLSLQGPAKEAWDAYMAHDPTSDWAREGRIRRQHATTEPYETVWKREIEGALRDAALSGDERRTLEWVRAHRQRAREWAEREILPQWSAHYLNGDEVETDIPIRIAAAVGAALRELEGDRLLSDGVAAIRAATSAGDTSVLRSLARGHRNLARGYAALYETNHLSTAGGAFAAALDDLEGLSPYALKAELYLALTDYYVPRYFEARQKLDSLAERIDENRYPVLLGRVLWIDGLVAIATQKLQRSQKSYSRALELFRKAGEAQNQAVLHALLAESLSKLGRYRDSWRQAAEALDGLPGVFNPVRHHAILASLILNARRQGMVQAVLPFADEHVAVAQRTGDDQIIHYAHLHRASLRRAAGMKAAAIEDLRRAAQAAEKLADPNLKRRTLADFDLTRAELLVDEDPYRADELLSRAIRTYVDTDFAYLLPRALAARSRARMRNGHLDEAEADLARQIELYDDSASDLSGDQYRIDYISRTSRAFEDMVYFQAVVRGRPWLAREYAERGRARALLASFQNAAVELPPDRQKPAIDIEASQSLRLPLSSEALVEYSALDDRLLIWISRAEERFSIVVPRGEEEITALVEGLRREILRPSLRGAENDMHYRAILYDLLVRPISENLSGIERLMIVPDKPFYAVPFEALWDAQRRRFLVEDYNVTYVPSASLYGLLKKRSEILWKRRPTSILAVSGSGDEGGYRYDPLPDAVGEACDVTSLYPGGIHLGGISVDKQHVLDRIEDAEIVHFAGHAIPNPDQPFASRLVLVDSVSRMVDLQIYELYGLRLDRLALVILSACSTAAFDPEFPSDGVGAMARPFLEAGVPGVIGSQWPVEDRITRLFFKSFHRRIRAGLDPPAALRATKLQFLQSNEPNQRDPANWAPFVVIGAFAGQATSETGSRN